VKAACSEEMTDSTVNATTFKLFKKGSTTKVAATVIYGGAAGNSTATLDPTNALKRGTTYEAVVTTAAKGLAGNRFDQNPNLSGPQQKAWTFKVRR